MPGRLWCAPGRREAPGLPGRHLPRWQPAWVGQVDLSTGAAWSAMPSVATGLVGQVDFSTGAAWAAMPSVATRLVGVVDFYTGAAWSAMPSVATRLIGVVDVCCLHTLHVSLRPAVVPSASICLPLRKVCLLLLVDVLLSARKWWVK